MTLKKAGENKEEIKNNPPVESGFDYNKQQKEILGDPTVTVHGALDSDDTVNALADLASAVSDKIRADEKQRIADTTMSSVPASAYERGGNTIVTPPTDSKAYTGPLSPREREDLIQRLNANTATDEDMARIDESMLIDLPFIKAASFNLSDNFNPKPKDPSIRFRWVNYVNFVQGNMMRLMADGFEVASIDDVDINKTPIHPKMLDGTQIKQYDVVLMKISVLKLMALYRRNIETAAFKLDAVASGQMQQAAAQQSFADLVGAEPGARGVLNHYRQASGREPVTFSRS